MHVEEAAIAGVGVGDDARVHGARQRRHAIDHLRIGRDARVGQSIGGGRQPEARAIDEIEADLVADDGGDHVVDARRDDDLFRVQRGAQTWLAHFRRLLNGLCLQLAAAASMASTSRGRRLKSICGGPGALARAPLRCHKAPRLPTETQNGQIFRTRVFRRAAHGQPASGQLSRRAQTLRRDAGDASVHLLRRRSACDDDAARSRAARAHDARGHRGVSRLRHRSRQKHRLQPEPRARTRRTRLDLRLRRAARLAQPHDPVQGESRQGSRERVDRPLQLPRADGGGHSAVSRHARARRRRPEAAPRARARHRAESSTTTLPRKSPPTDMATPSFRFPSR